MGDVLLSVFSSVLPPLPAGAGKLLGQVGWWFLVSAAVVAPAGVAGHVWWRLRARAALRVRATVRLVPTAGFDPSQEETSRHAAHLAQVSQTSDWLPRRASAVRIRHYCLGGELACAVQGPARAAALLKLPSYSQVDMLDDASSTPQEDLRIRFEGVPPLKKLGAEGSVRS